MWQRVQTLYMLISTVLIALMFFVNKSIIPSADGALTPIAEYRYTLYLPYVILIAIITALNLLALTTWGHRVFQMRTAILSALVTLALQIWIGVDFYLNLGGPQVFRISAVFPLLSVICDVMAARSIYSDILVVESISRLRSARKHHRR